MIATQLPLLRQWQRSHKHSLLRVGEKEYCGPQYASRFFVRRGEQLSTTKPCTFILVSTLSADTVVGRRMCGCRNDSRKSPWTSTECRRQQPMAREEREEGRRNAHEDEGHKVTKRGAHETMHGEKKKRHRRAECAEQRQRGHVARRIVPPSHPLPISISPDVASCRMHSPRGAQSQ